MTLPKDVIARHVQNLKSDRFEKREVAAEALEKLAEEGDDDKAIDEMVAAGALQPLVAELVRLSEKCSSTNTAADDPSKAIEALAALTKYGDDDVCGAIVDAGVLEPMVMLVSCGMGAYYDSENPAVLALCQLTALEDIKAQVVGLCTREIKQHVRLLTSDTEQQRQDAAAALNRYAPIDEDVMKMIIAEGAIEPLLGLIGGGTENRVGCPGAALALGILVQNKCDGVKAQVCEACPKLSVDGYLKMTSTQLKEWLGAFGEIGSKGGLPTGSKKVLSEQLKALVSTAAPAAIVGMVHSWVMET